MILIVTGVLGTVSKRLVQGTRGLRNKKSRDHPNDSIIKIGQNTKKSSVEFKRLAVTQTPLRNHQLTLAEKKL